MTLLAGSDLSNCSFLLSRVDKRPVLVASADICQVLALLIQSKGLIWGIGVGRNTETYLIKGAATCIQAT